MKFLCDEMLKGLGRWLRAAGYDTVIADNGVADRELIKQARDEGRLLITRDRKLNEFRDAHKHVILLMSNHLQDCVRELNKIKDIDWSYRPFSRCLLCNYPLREADPGQYSQIPEESRQIAEQKSERVYWCDHCNKPYWAGSHVRRMRKTLARWQDCR